MAGAKAWRVWSGARISPSPVLPVWDGEFNSEDDLPPPPIPPMHVQLRELMLWAPAADRLIDSPDSEELSPSRERFFQ